jgi:molybdate transport system substrate-binding protein
MQANNRNRPRPRSLTTLIAILAIAPVLLAMVASAGCKQDKPQATDAAGAAVAPASEANSHEQKPLILFAAASLTDVLDDLAARYTLQSHVAVTTSFAASSTLARQIEAGAPADVFISANVAWMDYLAERNLLRPDTRVDLLANALVIVAPKEHPFSVTFQPEFAIAEAFSGKLAMGDPEHVPAGQYARQALTALGWWDRLSERVAPAMDVRAALRLVELGEAGAGIVYATDAAPSADAVMVGTFPEPLHDPIRYPAAVCQNASPSAEGLLEFLRGEEAAGVFEKAGFVVLHGRPAP